MTIELGSSAPDFTLPDTHGTPVHLADLRGKPIVVVFFPFAFSGICTGELCELRDNIEEFEQAGVTVLGISCAATFAQRAWAEQQGITFEVLSDFWPVSYTHLRAHETRHDLVCRLLLEKKKKK